MPELPHSFFQTESEAGLVAATSLNPLSAIEPAARSVSRKPLSFMPLLLDQRTARDKGLDGVRESLVRAQQTALRSRPGSRVGRAIAGAPPDTSH